MSKWMDPVRWFDEVGTCGNCGKPAHGKLMGAMNESYGAFCKKCANSRLSKADKARAKQDQLTPNPPARIV